MHNVATSAQAGVAGAVGEVGAQSDGPGAGLQQQVASGLHTVGGRCAGIDCDVTQGADEYQLACTDEVFLRHCGRAACRCADAGICAHPVDGHAQGVDRHRVGLGHVSTGCACT